MRCVVGVGALLVVAASASASPWTRTSGAAEGAGKVVFGAGGDILAADASGAVVRRLAVDGSDPTVSPDGTRIAFERFASGAEYIVAMSADGTAQRRVGAVDGTDPVWSPDGPRLAYAGQPFRDDSIYVVNADGTATRRIASDSGTFGLAWSPDGKAIAYGVKNGIALVRVDGGGTQVVPTDSGKDPWRPSWSPDGTRVAFLSGGGLYVTNVDGSGETRLAEAEGPPTPAWSPDGKQILFARDHQISVIDADGSGERQLTRSSWGEGFAAPVWSPDGTRIAFRRGRFPDSYETDVWIMNADGSEPHVLATPLAQDGLAGSDDSPIWVRGVVSGGGAAGSSRMVTLTTKRRLSGLAAVSSPLTADGARAATAVPCPSTWDAGTGVLRREARTCSYTVGTAIAGEVVAWIDDEAGDTHDDPSVSTLSVRRAGAPTRQLAVASHFGATGAQLGNLFGDGPLLVFNTWHESRSGVTKARLWRADGARKTLVRSGGDVRVVAVGGGRIATLRPDGRLTLLGADGERLRALSLGRGIEGVRLDAARLVVLRRAMLEVYDAASGRLTRRLPTRLGPSGDLRLEDVDGGVAVYVAGLTIHLLRLSDGRDVALRLEDEGSEAHAQLEPAGLFYAYDQAWTTKPGRLGFVPRREVERRLEESA